jgi:hypothetical protein
MEGLEREGLEMERKEMERLKREGVNRLFIVYAKPNKHVRSQRHLLLVC